MISFKEFVVESDAKVAVGDEVDVHYKKMNGDTTFRGHHKVTAVKAKYFEIDRRDENDAPMRFNHRGYGSDYVKVKGGRVKGMSYTYGHVIKSLTGV